MPQIIPGQSFPAIDLAKVGGGRLSSADFTAPFFNVLNVYRGLHCPRCKAQLADFTAHKAEMAEQGIEVISISTDPADRAEQAVAEWGLGDMKVGYGLTIEDARGLGLFISESIREGETAFFAESALFLIQGDGILWGSAINSFPFMRPTAAMILDAAKTRRERSYPPRGNVAA